MLVPVLAQNIKFKEGALLMTQKVSYTAIGAGITLLVILGTITLAFSAARADDAATSQETESHSTNIIANTFTGSDAAAPLSEAASLALAQRTILLDTWAKSLAQDPGWKHTIVAYDFEEETHGTLPNGVVIPGDYVLDTWTYLDEAGKATSVVNIMKDMNGNMVQLATYRDGYWRSFADGEIWAGDPPVTPWQGFAESLIQVPNAIEQEEIVIDGRAAAVFSTRETHPPIPLEDANGELVSGHILREAFDLATGQPLKVETMFILEDGTEYFFSKYEFQLVETVKDLPPDVSELFSQEIENAMGVENQ